MAVRELKDNRPEYARRLKEFADGLTITQKQPLAIFVQVFWNDQEVTLLEKAEPGFNPLMAAGTFLRLATEQASGSVEQHHD